MQDQNTPNTDKRKGGVGWPRPPACICGARPDGPWPPCKVAVDEGRSRGADFDAEGCPRWQSAAEAAGWLLQTGDGR